MGRHSLKGHGHGKWITVHAPSCDASCSCLRLWIAISTLRLLALAMHYTKEAFEGCRLATGVFGPLVAKKS